MSSNSTPSRIKTRFLIISDTHNASPSQTQHVAFREPLPKADVLLHCGDLTMIGHLHEYEKTLDMLGNIDAELKLVIAGNHDISLDEEYYKRKGQYMHRLKGPDEQLPKLAREMWTGEKARSVGVTYLDEGVHSFTLKSGAKLRVCTSLNHSDHTTSYAPGYTDELHTDELHTNIKSGVRLTLPTRILRLGLPLLAQPRPLQSPTPSNTERSPYCREPGPRFPSHRRDDDTRSAHGSS